MIDFTWQQVTVIALGCATFLGFVLIMFRGERPDNEARETKDE